jgi:hypothetical protein
MFPLYLELGSHDQPPPPHPKAPQPQATLSLVSDRKQLKGSQPKGELSLESALQDTVLALSFALAPTLNSTAGELVPSSLVPKSHSPACPSSVLVLK